MDIQMDYTNSAYASRYDMPFALESGLSVNSYLKVVFPYQLHESAVAGQPLGMDASYTTMPDGYNCGSVDEY
jgi:hypothetical protein